MTTQRIDIRIPEDLLKEVEKYQGEENISNRSAALLELVRIGLKGGKASDTTTDFYVNEGAAIFVKGNMMLGIHPDNLENNLKALNNGNMGFDWEMALRIANGTYEHDERWFEKELEKDIKENHLEALVKVRNKDPKAFDEKLKLMKEIAEAGVKLNEIWREKE